MITIKGKYTNAKIMIDNVESTCLDQIRDMVNSPAFNQKVVIMPDTHAGKGSVVGFTMPLGDKIVPNCIGVDIGCGIYAFETDYTVFDFVPDWKIIDKEIRKEVPLGFSIRQKSYCEFDFYCHKIPGLKDLVERLGLDSDKVSRQVATLGGGNHFIEIARSEKTGRIWLLLHTGSRNLGKCVAEFWQKRAIAHCNAKRERILREVIMKYPPHERESKKKELVESSEVFNLPNDLCYLEHPEDKEGYMRDMKIAQEYAHLNKLVMAEVICKILDADVISRILSVHNYIDFEDHIIRKGATRARDGELFVVPFNMKDGTLICVGKGNDEWNQSAPHGAGRVLARGKAKRELSLQDFKDRMQGVWSTSVDASTLDESPMAYKDPQIIEEAIQDTCTVVDRLIPIYNLKASEKTE